MVHPKNVADHRLNGSRRISSLSSSRKASTISARNEETENKKLQEEKHKVEKPTEKEEAPVEKPEDPKIENENRNKDEVQQVQPGQEKGPEVEKVEAQEADKPAALENVNQSEPAVEELKE